MKKHIEQFILPDGSFFVNLLTEKLWVYTKILSEQICWRYKPGFYFFLAYNKNEKTV